MKKIIVVVALVAALAFMLGKANGGSKNTTGCVLRSMEGREVRIADFKGESVVLLFWATWCPYCRESLPVANGLYPDMKASGINLFGVNIQESPEKVQQYMGAHPVDFPILRDADGSCAHSFGIVGIPTYILINKDGRVVAKENTLPKNYADLLSR